MVEKILVVDDEPDIELLVKSKFRKKIKDGELEFIFASNGVEALAKVYEHADLCVVLTDINMPEMDGLTLLANLQKIPRVIKSIVVSAYGDMSNIRSAMNLGAADFIMKPIDFQDLEITINKIRKQCVDLQEALETKSRLVVIEKELEIACRLQQAMLPKGFMPMGEVNTFDLLGTMIPAKEVGGDFFDFFPLSKDKLGLVIADVSGKSIGAAFFMAITRTLIRAIAPRCSSPEEVMRNANALIAYENEASMFVTAFYTIFDINTGELTYCNAGHNPPYIISSQGVCRRLSLPTGIALGICEAEEAERKAPYRQQYDCLQKGDSLFLYTDGITEAMNEQGQLFGEKRLVELLMSSTGKSIGEIFNLLLTEIENFAGNTEQSDDQTLLCLRFLGT